MNTRWILAATAAVSLVMPSAGLAATTSANAGAAPAAPVPKCLLNLAQWETDRAQEQTKTELAKELLSSGSEIASKKIDIGKDLYQKKIELYRQHAAKKAIANDADHAKVPNYKKQAYLSDLEAELKVSLQDFSVALANGNSDLDRSTKYRQSLLQGAAKARGEAVRAAMEAWKKANCAKGAVTSEAEIAASAPENLRDVDEALTNALNAAKTDWATAVAAAKKNFQDYMKGRDKARNDRIAQAMKQYNDAAVSNVDTLTP